VKPLLAVFPYSVVFWLVFAWAFWPEYRLISRSTRPANRTGSRDRASCAVVMFGTWAAYAIAVPIASVRLFQFPAALRLVVFIAGSRCWWAAATRASLRRSDRRGGCRVPGRDRVDHPFALR
jgi:hypothetical protein